MLLLTTLLCCPAFCGVIHDAAIAGVRGQVVDATRFVASSEISASATPPTYILDAYCTDFEKDNPSAGTQFSLGKVNPELACILGAASSTIVKQVAVWIYTDKVSYSHVNEKFTVSQSDWDAATAIVRKCAELKTGGSEP